MRLLVYIEPTSYLMPLWREIKARNEGMAHIVFLEKNLTQTWDINLNADADATLLQGGGFAKLKQMLRLMGRRDLELVHLAGWGHPLLLAVLAVAWLRRIPVTMETDTPLPVGLAPWKRAIKRLIYPWLFKIPAAFLPGGKRQAAYLRHYGVQDNRIAVAQMTVDVSAISRYLDGIDSARRENIRGVLGLPDNATVFLYVGRMECYKGVPELIEAFGRLPVGECAPAILLLVGDGALRDMLDRALASDPRIRWPGRLSGTALLDAYAAADVLVLPSRSESWGLVVNEAMAAGMPVIATDRVGCVDDLVIEGKTGQVVPGESAEALAAAMEMLLVDPSLRENMARNARRLIAGWALENEADIIVNTWERSLEH